LELKLLAFLSGTLHILLFISAYRANKWWWWWRWQKCRRSARRAGMEFLLHVIRDRRVHSVDAFNAVRIAAANARGLPSNSRIVSRRPQPRHRRLRWFTPFRVAMSVLCEYGIAAFFAYFSRMRASRFFPHRLAFSTAILTSFVSPLPISIRFRYLDLLVANRMAPSTCPDPCTWNEMG